MNYFQLLVLNKNENFLITNHTFLSKNIKFNQKLELNNYKSCIKTKNFCFNITRTKEDTNFIFYPPRSGGSFFYCCLSLSTTEKNKIIDDFKSKSYYIIKDKVWCDSVEQYNFRNGLPNKNLIDGNKLPPYFKIHYYIENISTLKKNLDELTRFKNNKIIFIDNFKLFVYLRKMDLVKYNNYNVHGKSTRNQFIDFNSFYNLPKEVQKQIILYFNNYSIQNQQIIPKKNNYYYWDANWFLYKEDFLYNMENFYNILGLSEFDPNALGELYDIWINSIKNLIV